MTKITMKKIEVRGNVFIGFCLTIAEQVRCRSSLGGVIWQILRGRMFFLSFLSVFFVGKKKMLTFAMCLCIYEDFFTNKGKTLIRL